MTKRITWLHTLAGLLTAILSLTTAPALLGQQLGPFDSRPPETDARSPTERQADAVNELVAHLSIALRSFDTSAVSYLVPESAIPREERELAARRGCGPVTDVLASLSTQPWVRATSISSGLLLEVSHFTFDRQARTAALVGAIVVHTPGELRYAPVEITLAVDGGALTIRNLQGALAGLCGLLRASP